MSRGGPGPGPLALIGHTGFVGSTLLRSSGWKFDGLFNSRNIEAIAGRHFGTVVCAGVSAVKWLANREPEADWAGIVRLIRALEGLSCERFLLISTVDVYPFALGVSEEDVPADEGEPYGVHRLRLERWVADRFARRHVVRLPALFGDGLKKNALFDLLTGNMTERINPDAVFQWYPTARLAEDLSRVLEAGPDLLNVAVGPLRMGEIVDRFFAGVAVGAPVLPAPRYDMRTLHAPLLGGAGDHHLTAVQSLDAIGTYVAAVRARGGVP